MLSARREAKKKTQKHKQETDPRHTLYGHVQPRKRLRSRSSFMNAESLNPKASKKFILEQWKEWDQSTKIDSVQKPSENLPKGIDLTRKEWVTLNRARSKVGRTAKNKERWKLSKSSECKCGTAVQDMEHLLRECSLGPKCSEKDLLKCNEASKKCVRFYRDKI